MTQEYESLRLPPGFDPLNLEIMSQMDDSTLLSFCLVDKRGVALCNNEVFWRNRVMANYSLLLTYKEVAETYYQFYRRVYYDAYYLLRIGWQFYLCTDINLAYRELLQSLQLLDGLPVEGMTPEQLLAFDFDNYVFLEGNVYQILVIFKDHTVSIEDEPSQMIFKISEVTADRYLNPNLLSYPRLQPSGPLMGLYTTYNEELVSYTFSSLTTEILTTLFESRDAKDRYIHVPDSGNDDSRLGRSSYGFVMARKDVVLALLNPALYSKEYKSEFLVFVAPRDYLRTLQMEQEYTKQLITTPGAGHKLSDIGSLLQKYSWL